MNDTPTETAEEQPDQRPTPAPDDRDIFFPDAKVQSNGRLKLDARRAKRHGIEEQDYVEVFIPELDIHLDEIKVQTQFRVQIPHRFRERRDIEDGATFDVSVVPENTDWVGEDDDDEA